MGILSSNATVHAVAPQGMPLALSINVFACYFRLANNLDALD